MLFNLIAHCFFHDGSCYSYKIHVNFGALRCSGGTYKNSFSAINTVLLIVERLQEVVNYPQAKRVIVNVYYLLYFKYNSLKWFKLNCSMFYGDFKIPVPFWTKFNNNLLPNL